MGSWLSGIAFTLIVLVAANILPIMTTFLLMVLYVIGIYVVATDFPISVLCLYLSFLVPFFMVISGKAPGYTPVKLFAHEKKDKKRKKQQDAKDAPLDPRAQEIITCMHSYHDQFIKSHNQPAQIISANKVFFLSEQFIKRMSKTELDDFINDSEGTIENSARCAITLAATTESNSCKDANGDIHPEELPLELLTHLSTLIDIMNFVIVNECSANQEDDSDEEDDMQESQDDFWDDFEEVELSKEKEPLPVKKKETRSQKNPLLILRIVLLAAVVIMLPIVTYYCGLGKGYSEGYSVGKDDWYDDGYGDGSDDGYRKGYNAGYDDGRAAVDLDVPYEAGYEAGYSDALNGY